MPVRLAAPGPAPRFDRTGRVTPRLRREGASYLGTRPLPSLKPLTALPRKLQAGAKVLGYLKYRHRL
jgi:hypothetical protein